MAFIIIKTIILGIVEGLTEFIPVSSTAHLLLVGKIITVPQEFLEVLSISIQAGAILAAVWYFWKTIWSNMTLIPKVIVGFIPTAIVGVTLYPIIKPLFSSTTVIAYALILGGIVLLFITPKDTEQQVTSITYKQSLWIGLMQVFSFIPGVSRAGATLIGGTLAGIPREMIVAFSFLIAIPTILGASVVELTSAPVLSSTEYGLIALGGAVAFAVGLLCIRFFITFLTTKPLSYFGWYRIVVGILVLLFI
ncbi:undecaprenyl-diphosphate phosphatase [Patescibacteria group bacterium]|nr:undecaprenyl-diphosphate phosphatase [Patescibacteria group bacterium]